jgi:hypothetical protein
VFLHDNFVLPHVSPPLRLFPNNNTIPLILAIAAFTG